MKTYNILITGSAYWNPGDDLVRRGVENLVTMALRDTLYDDVNFHFFNFAQPITCDSPCKEQLNFVDRSDLFEFAKLADWIVVPGLAVGVELESFLNTVQAAGCVHKLVFVGGMNSNDYCQHYAEKLGENFWKQVRKVISRTAKAPLIMDKCKLGREWLPCPSFFGDYRDIGVTPPWKNQNILVSVQLPPRLGLVNHWCSHDVARRASEILRMLHQRFGHKVKVVCHHKSECLSLQARTDLPILFSSEWERLRTHYLEARCIVSTRLHSVLWGHALGVPGVVINNSERHVAALERYKHVPVMSDPLDVVKTVEMFHDADLMSAAHEEIKDFRRDTLQAYFHSLREAFGKTV